jgi:hypothetical protein
MPFNGSGTFTRNYNWVNDKIAGTPITASRMDAEFDNYANGLGQTITKDGQTILTGNIPFNNFKITGLGNGSARSDSIALGQVQDGSYTYLGTTTGSADAYTVAPAPTITAYATTQRFFAKIHATNTTTTPYLQISAIANPTTTAVIKKLSATKTEIALEASDLIANGLYEFQRNSANDAWIVLNPSKPKDLLATSTAQGILALTPNKIITLSNNATDATNDIDATAGWFNFDDGSGQAYYSGGTGQLDIVFGTNNGMLDAGTIANTTYHLFLIYNPTTLVSKILASTSVSSPTMPSGYTKKARIGSIIRASGAILAFEQFDKKFILGGTKIVDRAIAAPPTTASNQTVTAPAGISTRAVSLIECEPSSANGNTFLIIEPTTHTSTTPTSTNHTLFVWHQSGGPISLSTQIETKTNTSSQILINANISTSHNLRIIAVGWIDYQLNY